MRVPFVPWLLAPFLAVSAGCSREREAPLRFAWPPGSRAAVQLVERSSPPEREARSRFVVELAPEPDGPGHVLRHLDFQVATMTDPDGTWENLQTAFALLPPLAIRADGTFEGFADLDRYLYELSPGDAAPPQVHDIVEEFEEEGSPTRMLVRQELSDRWSTWVAAWLGMLPVAGTVLEHDELVFGATDPEGGLLHVRRECLELLERDGEPCARLRFVSTAEGDALRAALQRTLEDSTEASAPELESATLTRTLDALVEVRTLRPLEARSVQVHAYRVRKEGAAEPVGVEQRIEREYRFAWE